LKYIFIAGAPGSKWSSVCKNIYYSPSIDRSDYSDARTFYHDASGTRQLMHMGAYFDPGMEFGGFFDQLEHYTPTECETEFDRPFTGSGTRIIKSHVFAHQIPFLKKHWPDCPIVLVHRGDDACLGWWVKCGHFTITYPSYHAYYKNLPEMSKIITAQNQDILQAQEQLHAKRVFSNIQLCRELSIEVPPEEYQQDYLQHDINVWVV